MSFIWNNLLKRGYQKLTCSYYSITYSQTGEDQIVELFIEAKGIKEFTYLDIGANHPTRFNNTYKFYEQGFRGVCVEADYLIFETLSKKRKGDVCLNIGIGPEPIEKRDFFIMNNSLLNTFSREEAELIEKNGQGRILKIIQVPVKTAAQIIETHFDGKAPVFINLDVEGLDEEILKTFPFEKYRPSIFCIETVHFTINASSEKRTVIMDLMKSQRYKVFADTYINTIFIDADKY